MRAACQHDAPPLATAPPYVLPAPVGVAMKVTTEFAAPSLLAEKAPGHGRIDAPPPKAA